MASSRRWMPYMCSCSAVTTDDIAGASLSRSAERDAPLTTFSSRTSSSGLTSCAGASVAGLSAVAATLDEIGRKRVARHQYT